MGRIITVKGTGTASAKPDQVILKMNLKTSHNDYPKCMKLADTRCSILQSALKKTGFSAEEIKTADFRIKQDYHYGKNHEKIMDDWQCFHSLKVEFPLDIPRLKQILGSIASCGVQMEFSLDFTVSDGNALQKAMLANAAVDARQKAEILCSASGVKLGNLLEINYSWGELNIISHTDYEEDLTIGSPFATECMSDIAPEDINVRDTATFIWAIE